MFDLNFYKGKRVFVTGHTGFKGTWLCRVLERAGATIYGYSLEPPTEPSLYGLCGMDRFVQSNIGDIRDFENLKRRFDEASPEIVFHLAAQPIVRDGYRDPRYTYDTNVMGTVNILECIRLSTSVKSFVNVTTDKVYKNNESGESFCEDEMLDGFDPYSNSKSCSELVTHCYKNSFFSDGRVAISTARAGNVIGGGDFANDRIIPNCIRAALYDNEIILRNPYSVRPYQHVLESVFVYLMIAAKQYEDLKYEGSYNVGPDERDCLYTKELVDIFCNCWQSDVKWIVKDDGGPHEAKFLKLDCSKLKETFGWKSVFTIDTAMKKTVEWTREWITGNDLLSCMDRQIEEFVSLCQWIKDEG